MIQLLPQRQGDSVVLEGLPGLTGGSLDIPAQPVDRAAVSDPQPPVPFPGRWAGPSPWNSGGETGHRLRAHRGQLELAAQVYADAFLEYHAGVDDRHAHTPTAARLTVSRRS